MAFFRDFLGSVSPNLRFAIDGRYGHDPSAVDVTWHLKTQIISSTEAAGCRIRYVNNCVHPSCELISINKCPIYSSYFSNSAVQPNV